MYAPSEGSLPAASDAADRRGVGAGEPSFADPIARRPAAGTAGLPGATERTPATCIASVDVRCWSWPVLDAVMFVFLLDPKAPSPRARAFDSRTVRSRRRGCGEPGLRTPIS